MALEDLTAALRSATDAQQRNQTELTAALEKVTDAQRAELQRNQQELRRNQQELLNALRDSRDAL